ncbi:MAG: hypothetical protein KKD74_10340 [Bacteroidetes bacterium]|nr:hypothetical protein [Bacteroidota bacterium]
MKINKLFIISIIPLLLFGLTIFGRIENEVQMTPCASYGTIQQNYNGNKGCPYSFNFNTLISTNCTLTDIDLDRNTVGIQHSKEMTSCTVWTNGYDGIIHMLPKPGYGGQGFTVSNDVYVYFSNNTYEAPTWTMYVN